MQCQARFSARLGREGMGGEKTMTIRFAFPVARLARGAANTPANAN